MAPRNEFTLETFIPVGSEDKFSEPCALGIDEAGRGPVMGPMVYGAAFWPLSEQESIEKLGYDDSKALAEEQRESMFEGIKAHPHIGYTICNLSAECISCSMLQEDPISLNRLSHDAAISMIQLAFKKGINVKEVYVDTVGKAEYYEEKLNRIFGQKCKVVVCPKADSLYKVVSAASICAKVTRDHAIKEWSFDEKGVTFKPLNCSGYPSDVNTKTWLRENYDPVFGYPNLVRFSWSTVRNDMDHKQAHLAGSGTSTLFSDANPFVRASWPDPAPDDASGSQSILSFVKKAKRERTSYFASKNIKRESGLLLA